MSTTIHLPIKFDLSALYRFTRGIVGANGKPNDHAFVFDFAALNWVDGTGYTVFSNTLEWLISHDVTCSFRNTDKVGRPAIRYLDDCGFFVRYLGYKLLPTSSRRETTVPCTAIEHANAHGWLEYTLSPWLAAVLDVEHNALASVRGGVKELFNNIADHSTLTTGFVHAQHYPNMKNVRLTISDFGTGIPATIRERFGPMTDSRAIHYASQEGVTAKSQPNNMGAGLNYLIDSITGNHGTVRIYSQSGSLNCFRAIAG